MEAPPTPPVALGALLRDRELGLAHRAGPAETEVHGVHASEMADPSPYLLGGELLLTAGAALTDAQAYVARLAEAGVAALGFGVAPVHEVVPPGLAEACDRYGLPLLEVPPGTPFTAVARAVWRLMAEARTRELRRVTEAQQSLAAAAARPDPVPAVLSRLAATLGGWAALLPTTPAPAAPGLVAPGSAAPGTSTPGPAAPVSAHLPAASGRPQPPGSPAPADAAPADAAQGPAARGSAQPSVAPGSAHPLGVPGAAAPAPATAPRDVGPGSADLGSARLPRATGTASLAPAGQGPASAALGPAARGSAQPSGAAGTAAAGAAPPDLAGRVQASAGAPPGAEAFAAVAALARRVAPGAAATATDTLGGAQLAAYAVGGGHALALVTPSRAPGDHTVASVAAVLLTLLTAHRPAGAEAAALTRLLLDADPSAALPAGPWHVVLAHGPGDPQALAAALGTVLLDPRGERVRLLTDREPAPQPGWRLGVSAPARPGELPAAAAQARRALRRAEAARTPLVRHTDGGLGSLLDPAEARAHAEALLAPLGPVLRETLRAWLAHHGSWDRTAAALAVHRNTVRQRIARAATLLGTDLDDPDTRMELWFALRWEAPADPPPVPGT
ncbi:helix-turn-helix domain-containing protein [Streptomyces xanthophaeus]|uniref:helix-turn-helix domain-containing protein n=1 Tax=Streptomyces xanthophaeus TaxID=67385 RepID=UPI003865A94D|nr:helix-turn-helix domain-containing protein [Streptomyces xanthophaeus]WST62423.1 helix-turn-helix domain-containing protein [Streptomyces xanthophaeus]